MSGLAGKDFLLKSGDGGSPETFTVMGGLRTTKMTLDNPAIDITDQNAGQWTTLLGGAGVKKMTISGSGVFTNSAQEQLAWTRCLNGTIANYQVTDGVNTYTAAFKITKMERDGDYKNEQTYSLSFESSGAVTVA